MQDTLLRVISKAPSKISWHPYFHDEPFLFCSLRERLLLVLFDDIDLFSIILGVFGGEGIYLVSFFISILLYFFANFSGYFSTMLLLSDFLTIYMGYCTIFMTIPNYCSYYFCFNAFSFFILVRDADLWSSYFNFAIVFEIWLFFVYLIAGVISFFDLSFFSNNLVSLVLFLLNFFSYFLSFPSFYS